MTIKLDLHDNRPDIDTDVKNDDRIEPNLGTAALAKVLHIEDKTKAKTTNAEKKLVRVIAREGLRNQTNMQKKGEIRDERARTRTVK